MVVRLFNKHKYVNGICESDMDNFDDMYERSYRTRFDRSSSAK